MAAIPRVSPAEAKTLIDRGYVYLDVRSEPEYAAGHPEGAHNVPVLHMGSRGMVPNPEFLAVMQAVYPRDTRFVVGCRSGQRSMRAAEMLSGAGYTDVIDQRAGFDGSHGPFGDVQEAGWASAGLPVETVTPGGSYSEIKQKGAKA